MNKEYFYIANWKMYWTFDETIEFATKYYEELLALASRPEINIVLCPSAPVLYPLVQMFKETAVVIGAQDCSEHHAGSFTGQISAQHLRSVGCTYCIIGHSERRWLNAETNATTAKKLKQLLIEKITPIVCIGESEEEFKQGQSLAILEQQLEPIKEILSKNTNTPTAPILIAYEPTWSIGSDTLAPQEHLETVFAWLSTNAFKGLHFITKKLVYGGSTSPQNIHQLKQIPKIDGFLIGRASLNFQEFEKIIKYCIKEGL